MSAPDITGWLRRPPLPSAPLTIEDCDAADAHGVAALLYAAVRDAGALEAQAPEVRERLARTAREQMLLDAIRGAETMRVLDALAAAGVPALVFKGAALAHLVYAEPWMRRRTDVDLLIRREELARADAALTGAGYLRVPRPAGAHVTHQQIYTSRRAADVVFDLHWKIADPQAFADLFEHDELAARAVAVPALGSAARTLDHGDALLVACVHRVAHHFDHEMLQFTCDIDRLARELDAAAWRRVASAAARKRIRQVVRRGLQLSERELGTPVPPDVVDELASGGFEPSARYLRPGLRKIDIFVSDLRQLPSVRARLRLILEHLFPPADFVRAAHQRRSSVPLPLVYLRRIVRGARRWLTPLN